MRSPGNGFCAALGAWLVLGSILVPGCGKDQGPVDPGPDSGDPPYVAAPATVLILDDRPGVLRRVEATGTIELDALSPEARTVRVGSILLGRDEEDAPAGFLRRVESMETVGGTTILETGPALLEQAFESMDVLERHTLRPSMVEEADLREGTRLISDPEDDALILDIATVLHDGDADPATTGDELALRGELRFEPELLARIVISDFRLECFETGLEMRQEARLAVEAGGPWSFDDPRELTLVDFRFRAISVAGVVWITPTLTLTARLQGELVTLAADLDYRQTTTNGIAYERGAAPPLRANADATRQFDFIPPRVDEPFDFEFGTALRTKCLIQGAEGPTLNESTDFLLASRAGEDLCEPELSYDLRARPGFEADIAMEGEVLDLVWSGRLDLEPLVVGHWIQPHEGTGTLILDLEPEGLEAPWWISGPCDYNASGKGAATLTGLVEGRYVVSWGEIPGWTSPAAQSPVLGAGETVSALGSYEEATGNRDPLACFAIDPATGTPSTEFSFDASCSTDPDAQPEPLLFRWDWEADGTWDHPAGGTYTTLPVATHTFNSAGTRHVLLEVRDPDGNTDTEIRQLVVGEEPDTIPPGPVMNLQGRALSPESILLEWLAPGDDGFVGTARGYDLRYSKDEATILEWTYAIQADREPPPSRAGETDRCIVAGLDAANRYHFAIRVVDEAGNWSPISSPIEIYTEFGQDPDEYEPDESPEDASELLTGTTQIHSILPVEDTDWYRFTLFAAADLSFDLSGLGSPMALWLHYQLPDGELIPAWPSPKRIPIEEDTTAHEQSYNMPAGQYFLRASAENDTETTPRYEIRLDVEYLSPAFSEPYLHEPNDSSNEFSTLESGVDQKHALVPLGDEDWLRFWVPEAADLVITLGGGLSPFLAELSYGKQDGSLDELWERSSYFPYEPSAGRSFQNQPSGYYFLRILEPGGSGLVGYYHVQLDIETLGTGMVFPYAYEPNDYIRAATTMESGIAQDHAIAPLGDVDCFGYTVALTSDVTITTSGSHGRLSCQLFILSTDGNTSRGLWALPRILHVDHDDDANNHVFLTSQSSGTYVLMVREDGENALIGDYRIQIDVEH